MLDGGQVFLLECFAAMILAGGSGALGHMVVRSRGSSRLLHLALATCLSLFGLIVRHQWGYRQNTRLNGYATSVKHGEYQPTAYVNDFGGGIDLIRRFQLERICSGLDDQYNARMLIVTVKSLSGKPIADLAEQVQSDWGYGYRAPTRVIVVVVSVAERQYYINVGPDLDFALTSQEADHLGIGMEPLLQKGDVGGAVMQLAKQIQAQFNQTHG